MHLWVTHLGYISAHTSTLLIVTGRNHTERLPLSDAGRSQYVCLDNKGTSGDTNKKLEASQHLPNSKILQAKAKIFRSAFAERSIESNSQSKPDRCLLVTIAFIPTFPLTSRTMSQGRKTRTFYLFSKGTI